jgi:hypothetical protein
MGSGIAATIRRADIPGINAAHVVGHQPMIHA